MSKKSKLDQYYIKAKVADHVMGVTIQKCVPYTKYFVEPAAGKGTFSALLIDRFGKTRVFAFDIDPKANHIKLQNFLEYILQCETNTVTTILAPPFGWRAKLAIEFFNRCAGVSKFIVAIVPMSFKKHSIQSKLNPYFHTTHSEDLPHNSFILNEKPYHVNCCLQIWERLEYKRKTDKLKVNSTSKYFDFVKKNQNPDVAIVYIGNKAGKIISLAETLKYSREMIHYIKIKDELLKLGDNIYRLNRTKMTDKTAASHIVLKPEIIHAVNLLMIKLLSEMLY